MKKNILLTLILLGIFLSACNEYAREMRVRNMVDTTGFAQFDWQMDSIMDRIARSESDDSAFQAFPFDGTPRVIISPHDDYTYVGKLYRSALGNIRAGTIIIFGVAHKARLLGLEDRIIFDSFDYWHGPYGNVKISGLRKEIMQHIPMELYEVNDSMQAIEHSVEALVPFLQYFNRDVEIVPILVPSMPFVRMEQIATVLAASIHRVISERNMAWGEDFAILISTDAVHYGDEDWGGKDFAIYGTDSSGYSRAIEHENMILGLLSGELLQENVRAFCDITVREDDHREYKWTWCGRYSVPLGLLTAIELNGHNVQESLNGFVIGYASSIDHSPLPVDDLRMGSTAPANQHHWVGYAALGYN